MNELAFNRWLLHTSRDWDDIKDIVKKTYIPIIDQDHKQLARYALDLNLILEKIQRKEISLKVLKEEKKTLKQFLEYTEEHFRREERIIKYFMLGNMEEQQEDHQKTIDQIKEVASNLEKGKIIFTQDQKTELLENVIEHTNGLDAATLKIESFSFIFEKMKSFNQLKLFINLSGIPFIDDKIINFFSLSLELLSSENKDVAVKKIEEEINSIITETNEYILNNKFLPSTLKLRNKVFDQLDVSSVGYKSRILCRLIYFVAIEIAKPLDLSQWLPQYLQDCQSFDDIKALIRIIGYEEIDHSFEQVIRITFQSFDEYINKDVDMQTAKSTITKLALQLNQHFITTEKTAKQNGLIFEKYHSENFKRLRMYLDKAFIHLLEDRLEYSINLRNKILYHCLSQNNFHDYATFVFQPMDFLIEETAA